LKIEETNMALFGSALEKKIKHESSLHEHQWTNAGTKPGLEVWSIEKFKVVPWPKNAYGQFYDGDSYIVLNTIKQDDKLRWDIHFWLGMHTSQDEAGTAAYKTVELDNFLGGVPVQYREVQDCETREFLGLFPVLQVLQGGCESGFKHYSELEKNYRLLWIKGAMNKAMVREIPLSSRGEVLNHGDAFILDCQKEGIWTILGKKVSTGERVKAAQMVEFLQHELRRDVPVYSCRFEDTDEQMEDFWRRVGGKVPVLDATAVGADQKQREQGEGSAKRLMKVSNARSGSIEWEEILNPSRANLDTSDVFLAWDGATCFIWVGKGSNKTEQGAALMIANKYLAACVPNKNVPVVTFPEGQEPAAFTKMWK